MRLNLFVLVFLMFIGFSLQAQTDVNKDDEKKTEQIEKKKSTSRDRLILELNYNDWLNKPDSIKTKWYGRGLNVYFMYDFKLGNQDIVSFAPGIGISSHNVYHNSQIAEVLDSTMGTLGNTNMYIINDTIAEYRTNKLNTNYIEVPLELRFKSKPNKYSKSFKVAIGARFGYLFNAHTKYRGDELNGSGREVKYKEFLLPNINKLRFGPSLRIGYGNFSVVSYYSLTGVFAKDVAPQLNAFSVGISFNSF